MSIFEVLRRMRNSLQSSPLRDVQDQAAQSHLLMGRLASLQMRSRPYLNSLEDAEFRVSSQTGQDGIIDWLIERAEIPTAARSFIEFGVESYRQSNTRFLLRNRNWRGLIMDSDPKLFNVVRSDRLAAAHDLTVRSAFITRETINGLIAGTGFRGEIGLLSIDLDGNDYWVWEAIENRSTYPLCLRIQCSLWRSICREYTVRSWIFTSEGAFQPSILRRFDCGFAHISGA